MPLANGDGTWVGIVGAFGYYLPQFHPSLYGFDGLVGGSFTVDFHGSPRYDWADTTTDVRALEDPSGDGTRSASTVYDPATVHLTLHPTADFSGMVTVYVLGWDQAREAVVSVNGGASQDSGNAQDGVWLSFPAVAASGGSIDIIADIGAGYSNNVTVSGVFLDAGPLPAASEFDATQDQAVAIGTGHAARTFALAQAQAVSREAADVHVPPPVGQALWVARRLAV